MKRRFLMTHATAAAVFAPNLVLGSERERRISEARIHFIRNGLRILPIALLALTAAGPYGWNLRRNFPQFPVASALLGALALNSLRATLPARLVGAVPWGDVFLYENLLALRPLSKTPLPRRCTVTHGDIEWQIKQRARKLAIKNIPGLDALFRTRIGRAYATQSELIVFLRPTLIKEP
ncbi:hypothetical protein [Aliiroseovarius sp. PrR006]|uniref:hypothetical protein n=1 Tax=Aliiroseovarius sp. PrR006 TaxID=2706883 RepID=UPI0013D1B8BE|nr:hypothetical protein [Aliiroseovarius sp. PrR006]NDW53042.1 hypothetical protein [Aliiroseovarius sp. PrR006]